MFVGCTLAQCTSGTTGPFLLTFPVDRPFGTDHVTCDPHYGLFFLLFFFLLYLKNEFLNFYKFYKKKIWLYKNIDKKQQGKGHTNIQSAVGTLDTADDGPYDMSLKFTIKT